MGTEKDNNIFITPVTGLRFLPKGLSWPIAVDNTVSSRAKSESGSRLLASNRLITASAFLGTNPTGNRITSK